MSFVSGHVCFPFVMNASSWPRQALFGPFAAAGGSRLGRMSDDLGDRRPMSLFVALNVHGLHLAPGNLGVLCTQSFM